MVQTPNSYTLKGRLQIVLDGTDTVVELGEVEVPIRVDFRPPPTRPGGAYRGPGISGNAAAYMGSNGDGTTNVGHGR